MRRKLKTPGDWIIAVGDFFFDIAFVSALFLLNEFEPSWQLVYWCAGFWVGFIMLGAGVDAVREVIREVREGRL